MDVGDAVERLAQLGGRKADMEVGAYPRLAIGVLRHILSEHLPSMPSGAGDGGGMDWFGHLGLPEVVVRFLVSSVPRLHRGDVEAAAREALGLVLNRQGDEVAREPEALVALVGEVFRLLPLALRAADLPGVEDAEIEVARVLADGGVASWDRQLGSWLGELDFEVGQRWTSLQAKAVDEVRQAQPSLPGVQAPGSSMWARWHAPAGLAQPGPRLPFLVYISTAGWPGIRAGVEERVRRRDSWRAPGLPLRGVQTLGRVRPGVVYDQATGRLVDSGGHGDLVIMAGGPVVPAMLPELLREERLAGIGRSSWHKAIRWLAVESYRAAVRGDGPELVVEGGYAGLAEVLGLPNHSRDELRTMLETMVHTTLSVGDLKREGSIFHMVNAVFLVPAAPGRRAVLRVEPGPLFRPGAVHLLPAGDPGRMLVPVLGTDPPIPPGLHSRFHAGIYRLEWAALSLLAQRSRESPSGLTSADWTDLAHRVGLSDEVLSSVLVGWTGAERWTEAPDGRWHLGAAERDAAALLEDGARLSAVGRARGKASARKRRGTKRTKPDAPRS